MTNVKLILIFILSVFFISFASSQWVLIVNDTFNDGSINNSLWSYDPGQGVVSEINLGVEPALKVLRLESSANKFPLVGLKNNLPKAKSFEISGGIHYYDSLVNCGTGIRFTDACGNFAGQVWADSNTGDVVRYSTYPDSGDMVFTLSGYNNWRDFTFLRKGTISTVFAQAHNYTSRSVSNTVTCSSPIVSPTIKLGNVATCSGPNQWNNVEFDWIEVYCNSSTEICDGWDNDCDWQVDEGNVCNPVVQNVCTNNRSYDLAFYGPENNGYWHIVGANGKDLIAWYNQWGYHGTSAVSGDYNGDGRDDLAVYDNTNGRWYIKDVNGTSILWDSQWGFLGAKPVSGDYNGDGKSDLAVYYPNSTGAYWYIKDVNGTVLAWGDNWGYKGAIPVSGDYNGDGRDDLAVYDSASGKWYIKDLNGTSLLWDYSSQISNGIPVSGDYNGDGKSDLALFYVNSSNAGNWKVVSLNGSVIFSQISWGYKGVIPVSGDFNGNGKFDFCVYDNVSHSWYISDANGSVILWNYNWGYDGAVPVSGDFDFSCTAPTNVGSLSSFWSNLNFPLTSISTAEVGDSVLMVHGGVNLQGKTVSYRLQVFNSSSIWYNPFSWFSYNWNDLGTIGGLAKNTLVANYLVGDKLRFNSSISGTNVYNLSNNLTLTASNNALPSAQIVWPSQGNYKVNTNILFSQLSGDSDDLLKIIWDFGDGSSSVSINNYSIALNSSSADVSHSYSQPGQYTIKLTAQEMTRLQTSNASRNILLFKDGVNVVPVISSPQEGASVGTGVVFFNLSNSFVANCSSGVMTPLAFKTDDNLLNCSYLLVPGSRTLVNANARVLVNWSMDDGTFKIGNWTSDYNGVVNFGYYYSTPGTHMARVRMDYYA
jgi:hypothetical protein